MTLDIPHYSVKSEEIRAAALCELAEAVIDDEVVEGLSELVRVVLKSDKFDQIVPLLAVGQHLELALLLAPLNAGMPAIYQRLWLESIYEFYCAHNTSLAILTVFFPGLTRRKHEKFMKRNINLLMSKTTYLSTEKEAEVHTAFKELLNKYPDTDIREIYMMLQERFVDIAMTTLIRQTASYVPGSDQILAALKGALKSKNAE